MTPRQTRILNTLREIANSDNSITISIHDLGFPVSPDWINPALQDFAVLKEEGMIGDFERVSSREVHITNINYGN